jgi:CRP-like cAMP-binding protein
MNLYPLEVRLARYIFECQLKEDDDIAIIPHYNDLAEFLGSSYRHLNRSFNQLVNKGIIQKKGKMIKILDKNALAAIAGDIIGSEFYY